MICAFVISLSLLLITINAGLPSCKQSQYQFYYLVLTQPDRYCDQKGCNATWQKSFDRNTFTIHGFWPSSTDLSYLSCLISQGKDPYCERSFRFSQSYFTKQELAQLNKYWPQSGNIKAFWSYEWRKHGTCYLAIMKDWFKSKLSDTQIMKDYFMGTVQKAKSLNITLKSGTIQTKNDLAKKINLHPSQFQVTCQNKNILDQIMICYDIYSQTKQQQIIPCPKTSNPNFCRFPITVK